MWFDQNSNFQIIGSFDDNLERVKNAFKEAGSPHEKMNNVIHVAGTNGKGSTIAFLESILLNAGFSVNTTTSPHLVKFNERIRLNGVEISNEKIDYFCQKYKYIAQKYNLTFFERSILVAYAAFAESDADFNIIEVGLGGLLDATNIIPDKKICIITSIDLDHTNILGNTIAQIAANKAGIITENSEVIIGNNSQEAIAKIIENRNNKFYICNRDWLIDKNIEIGLIGEHQYENAGNAITAARIIGIDDEKIYNGIKKTKWAARLHCVDNIIIDGAHNPAGINALCNFLNKIPSKKVGIMYIMKDKDADKVASIIDGVFDTVYCIKANSFINERAMDNYELACKLKKFGINAIDTDRELFSLIDEVRNKFDRVVIFGSLFLCGEVLKNKLFN